MPERVDVELTTALLELLSTLAGTKLSPGAGMTVRVIVADAVTCAFTVDAKAIKPAMTKSDVMCFVLFITLLINHCEGNARNYDGLHAGPHFIIRCFADGYKT